MASLDFDKFQKWVDKNNPDFEKDLKTRWKMNFIWRFLTLLYLFISFLSFSVATIVFSFLGLAIIPGSIIAMLVFLVCFSVLVLILFFYINRCQLKLTYAEYLASLLMQIANDIEYTHRKNEDVLMRHLKELSDQNQLKKKEYSSWGIVELFKRDIDKQETFKLKLRELPLYIHDALGKGQLDVWSSELLKIRTLAWSIFNINDEMYVKLEGIQIPKDMEKKNFLTVWDKIGPLMGIFRVVRHNIFIIFLIYESIIILLCFVSGHFLDLDNGPLFTTWGVLTAAVITVLGTYYIYQKKGKR